MAKSLAAVAALTVWGASQVALSGPVARLSFDSQPGAFIGDGHSLTRTFAVPPDDVGALIPSRLPDGTPIEVQVGFALSEPPFDFGFVDFGNVPLRPGFYPDAQRTVNAAPGHPGMDFGFDGVAGGSLTGNYTILALSFSPDNSTLLGLRVQFEAHIDGQAPAVFGRFEYEADGVLVPEPALGTLVFAAGLLGLRGARRRNP